MRDDGASEPDESRCEGVAESLPVALAIREHGHPLQVQLLGGVIGRGRALELVGGRQPEEVVDPGRPELQARASRLLCS